MKATLPATHLLRRFFLYAFTILLLLTIVRAGFSLWLFQDVQEADALIPLFLQGLRFDLAIVGALCIVPLVIGYLLGMIGPLRPIAKIFLVITMLAGLLFIMIAEFVTPWFLQGSGVRPDFDMLKSAENPVASALEAATALSPNSQIPLAIAAVLMLLITLAFLSRLELPRLLHYRLSVPQALLMSIVGALACLVAIWSTPDLRKPMLSNGDALISANAKVNDLAMNSAWKILFSAAQPYLDKSLPDFARGDDGDNDGS